MISGIVRKSSLLAVMLFAACGKDSSGPSAVATTVAVATTTPQSAVVGTVVAPALTFSVKDQNGNVLAGVPITITVTGGGTITGAPTTTTAGETSVGVWTLGTIVGVNTITIKAGDLAPVTFSITTVAGAPAQITTLTGGGQSALAGTTITGIGVRVVDKFGNGVAGQPVTVTVLGGGGTVTPKTGTTDASGNFTGVSWTLGKLALPQILSFASNGITGTVSATVQTNFPLEIVYFPGDPTPEVRALFDSAVARIRGLVTAQLSPVNVGDLNLNSGRTNCGVPVITPANDIVRGIRVYATIKAIDGPGKVLGGAGPCLYRVSNRLTTIGVAQFDEVDLADVRFQSLYIGIITHELLHVLGIGTLWCVEQNDGTCTDWLPEQTGVTSRIPSLLTGFGTADPRYTGSAGINGCIASGGTTACAGGVAVENCVGIPRCGAGTRDSHWRERIFDNELMTGFAQDGMALSVITSGGLTDLGYQVNNNAVDPYTVPPPGLRALLQQGDPAPQWQMLHIKPKAAISSTGVVKPMTKE